MRPANPEEITDSLSIVMPVYNEEAVIVRVLSQWSEEVLEKVPSSELIVVNDASSDSTQQLLECFDGGRQIRIEHSAVNRGHGPTLLRAMHLASGQWIFHVDSDGQFLPSDFWKLWDSRERADLLLGIRLKRRDPLHRNIMTRLVRLAASALAGKWLSDSNVPFRLIRRSLWDDLAQWIPDDALAPSIMMSIGAANRGWRVHQTPVSHLARPHGKSSLRMWALVRFSFRGLVEICVFRFAIGRKPTNKHG